MSWRRALLAVGVAGLAGSGAFLVLAWGAITTEETTSAEAATRVAAVRALFDDAASLLVRRPDGRIARREQARPDRSGRLAELHILTYRASARRIASVEIPFWFYRLKAPAAQFLVRDTGFDLGDLGVTADELERHGEGIILDEEDVDGDRLLIWTRR